MGAGYASTRTHVGVADRRAGPRAYGIAGELARRRLQYQRRIEEGKWFIAADLWVCYDSPSLPSEENHHGTQG